MQTKRGKNIFMAHIKYAVLLQYKYNYYKNNRFLF